MARSSSALLCCLLRCVLFVAAGEDLLVDFDPFTVFRQAGESAEDLILVLHPARSLGRTPLYTALRDFADAAPNLGRKRGLVVSHCRDCFFLDQVVRRWHLHEEKLPIGLLFPHRQENSDEGRFLLDLKQWSTAVDIGEALRTFVQRYDAGKEHSYLYSQPVPTEEDQDELVRELVGDSFQSEVIDRLLLNISTLVLFYRPWCGWCRQVQPVFKEIGKKLGTKNPLLRVARMDTDQNELVPGVHAVTNTVPTIYLFLPNQSSNPLQHTHHATRTVEDIFAWCQEHVPGLEAQLKTGPTSVPETQGLLGDAEDL